ncbi:SDR family NAD(P)-dependent oxidoreductase [Flavihumibacter solisilvae]|uniref:Oxidoreductase n=1 Tax=Flavihumibacter solisilvae TaxID=1349421 RepID=A0A0C1KZG0_9BACT|nr:glucose 1-dehydrogenase [Flavihumibacter solisilvae]KIC92661.1 oxidoreductase [Flavihumibacter solisilvae]
MELNIKDKVAIVTGASKGIGAGIAKALAAEGVKVTVNYSSNKEDADRVVYEIESKGGKAIAVQANVGKQSDVSTLFNKTIDAFGKVNIIVNNAGIFKAGPVESITEEQFVREFNVNVFGQILMIQEALRHFPKDGGNIVNITSVSGDRPTPNFGLYSSTKAAVNSLTRAVALELAARKIRVNAVAPGTTETEGIHALGLFGSEAEKTTIASIPLGRVGQPDDIAKVVVFLVSDAGAWITGEKIVAAGGFY